MNAFGKVVELLRDPVGLGLKNRDTAQYEVFLVWVCGRSGIVEVKQMHGA